MIDKKFVFISDFDGTLTNKDFYEMIIDDYLGEGGEEILKAWQQKKYRVKDFLNIIYDAVNKDENEMLEDMLRIEWDNSAGSLMKKVQEAGGEFIIISEGTSCYISRILEEKGFGNIKVYSNSVECTDEEVVLKVDEKSPYYSEFYGIDKEKVVRSFKEKYDYVYYAGDSTSDISPCRIADECFAKGALQEMLKNERVNFIPMNNFRDVEKYLIDKGVIK